MSIVVRSRVRAVNLIFWIVIAALVASLIGMELLKQSNQRVTPQVENLER